MYVRESERGKERDRERGGEIYYAVHTLYNSLQDQAPLKRLFFLTLTRNKPEKITEDLSQRERDLS